MPMRGQLPITDLSGTIRKADVFAFINVPLPNTALLMGSSGPIQLKGTESRSLKDASRRVDTIGPVSDIYEGFPTVGAEIETTAVDNPHRTVKASLVRTVVPSTRVSDRDVVAIQGGR